MLLNTLASIEKLIKENLQMNDEHIKLYLNIFKYYDKERWIYPGVIKRKLKVPIIEVYSVLSCMEEYGILKSFYEIYCNNCQHSAGEVFEAFNELPDEYECDHCGSTFSGLENAIIIYKVIVE